MMYTTQMDAAKKGIITKEMEIVARKESMDEEVLREKIARGVVALPANKNHKALNPEGVGGRQWDNEMSTARQNLNWDRMFELAIDPEKARRYRKESMPEHEHSCTMCGKMCSMRTMNKIMQGKDLLL